MTEKMARAAAHWWAQKIDGNIHHDNGDRNEASVLAGIFADILAKPAGNDELQAFEDNLTRRIMTEESYRWYNFGCDYGPDAILCDAAKDADVDTYNFPWKTRMHIRPDEGIIEVSEGYQAPWVTIYTEEEL